MHHKKVCASVVCISAVDTHSNLSADVAQGVKVTEVPTKPYEGQKTGTSGLRKRTKEFMQVCCPGLGFWFRVKQPKP